jgi:diphosphomevalonate decarboxylase
MCPAPSTSRHVGIPAGAQAQAHPNIALIKYWGKVPGSLNVSAVESISITLNTLRSQTRVRFDAALPCDALQLDGVTATAQQAARVSAFLDLFRGLAKTSCRAHVCSDNNFPTGAGLASSASGFASLAVAAAAALGLQLSQHELSSLARQGSGSAARSLFGGYVHLRRGAQGQRGAPNTYDTYVEPLATAADWPLQVVVGITSKAPKALGSTAGMERSRLTSPYYASWVQGQDSDIGEARAAIAGHDFARLADIAEHSCLKMHGLAMASRPGIVYWNATTLQGMQAVQAMRKMGIGVFFTVDAGPQVKAICEPAAVATVAATLRQVPGMLETTVVGLGEAPTVSLCQEP